MATLVYARVRFYGTASLDDSTGPWLMLVCHHPPIFPDSFSSWMGLPLLRKWTLESGRWQ